MSNEEKKEAVTFGIFLAFLLFLGLIEQQKQENTKIRELRKKVNATGGEIDFQNLQNDWQNVRGDLKTASKKVLSNA